MTRIESPSPATDTNDALKQFEKDLAGVVSAVMQGDLSKRCPTDYASPALQQMGTHVNQLLEQLLAPLRAAAVSLDKIAHGDIPEFIIEEYNGEFNSIKNNINNFLATMYGMHYEVKNLISAINEGKLRTRGNDWDYVGIWKELITGVNSVLDAVMEPVNDASDVLEQVAQYNLTTRMTANYKGDHARIKHALNSTIDTLTSALTRVSAVVNHVSSAGEEVLETSQRMFSGSDSQSDKVSKTLQVLQELLSSCHNNTEQARTASVLSKEVFDTINQEKVRVEELLGAIDVMKEQAEGTQQIIHALNEIGEKTDALSAKASKEAINVTSSSRGFSVVAEQITRLATQSRECARTMYGINKNIGQMIANEELEEMLKAIDKLNDIAANITDTARETKFIAVNAAVNSAHVSDAGECFEDIVKNINGLSSQNKEATGKSESLIRESIAQSSQGHALSKEVNDNLNAIVEKVSQVANLVQSNQSSSENQTKGIDELNLAVNMINEVTAENSTIAEGSARIAQELADQTQALSSIVSQFQLVQSEQMPLPASNR